MNTYPAPTATNGNQLGPTAPLVVCGRAERHEPRRHWRCARSKMVTSASMTCRGAMSFVRVQYVPGFKGQDVVLLAIDAAGASVFHSALNEAVRCGSSYLAVDGVTHEFLVRSGTAVIELGHGRAVWQLDDAVAAEITKDLGAIAEERSTGHYYVDIHSPAETLMISCGEYPPEFFDQFAAMP